MLEYILKRLILIVPTLFGILTFNFIIIQAAPGGPVEKAIAQIKGNGKIDKKITQFGLKALQVDAFGLDEMDNKILISIIDKFNGGPVGITTLATAVSENAETIEEVYEPFLIQQGFIVRTPRGREVTMRAYKHLGRIKNSQGGLF